MQKEVYKEKRNRKLFRSYGIMRVISFFYQNPNRYYIPKEICQKIDIEENTWATAYRPVLTKNSLIKKYLCENYIFDGRKRAFEFNKSVFENKVFYEFNKYFAKLSDNLVSKIKRLRKKCNYFAEKSSVTQNNLLRAQNLQTHINFSSKYEKEIKNLFLDCRLKEILEKTGNANLLSVFWSNMVLNFNDINNYKKIKKNLSKAKNRIKFINKNKDPEKYTRVVSPIERKLSKTPHFLIHAFDVLFDSLEAIATIKKTKSWSKNGLIYEYFIKSLEKVLFKKKVYNFNELFAKIIKFWARNSENSLKGREVLLLSNLPIGSVPKISDICLLNEKLK
jgi:hypothetical protein